MACGTPVIGFRIGGLPDMVQPCIGNLADPSAGSSALVHSIIECLKEGGCSRQLIREYTDSRYALEKQAAEYLSLYRA